jgi:hypothetical protein
VTIFVTLKAIMLKKIYEPCQNDVGFYIECHWQLHRQFTISIDPDKYNRWLYIQSLVYKFPDIYALSFYKVMEWMEFKRTRKAKQDNKASTPWCTICVQNRIWHCKSKATESGDQILNSEGLFISLHSQHLWYYLKQN